MANIKYQTTVPYRNNLVGGSPAAATIDALTDDLHYFNFSIKWTGADRAVSLGGTPAVDLGPVTLTSPAFIPATNNALYVEWAAGTLPGTIKENYYSNSSLITSIDNVDPGYGSAYSGTGSDSGRDGPRYTFAYFANRLEVYKDFTAKVGQIPIVSVPVPTGLPLPSLANPYRMQLSVPTNVNIRNVTFNGLKNLFKASFRVEDQVHWFGSQQSTFYIRMYQKGAQMNGVPLDIVFP